MTLRTGTGPEPRSDGERSLSQDARLIVVHWPAEDVYSEAWEVFDSTKQDSVAWFSAEAEAMRVAS